MNYQWKSGNWTALVGAVKGYKTIIIMPDSVSEERRKLVKHYGAEVILIHDDGDIGKCIDECLKTALKGRGQSKGVCTTAVCQS